MVIPHNFRWKIADRKLVLGLMILRASVVDPHHVDEDPDPAIGERKDNCSINKKNY